VRQLRALLRHRVQLVRLRTLLRNRIHAVLADHGYGRPAGCWSGPGRDWLASLPLPAASREVAGDGLALTGATEARIDRLDGEIRQRARSDPRVKVLTQLPGAGPFTALVILAETGDITRFPTARKLASRAGLTPAVRGSDRVAHYGHISKQGPVWLRQVLCEAAQTARRSPQSCGRLPGHRPAARQEDRHHRDRPQAAHPYLAPAHRRRARGAATRHRTGAGQAVQVTGRRGRQAPGELEEHLRAGSAALEELTEQPGPRMPWSWRPAPAGRAPNGWM
jgi:hypothetical protein